MIQYNGLTLAYIGDAYYELSVRNYLLSKQLTKVNELHDHAITYTNAFAQAKAARQLLEGFYTEAEIAIYKRGRNATASHKPKNADVATYNTSTGFEAVIGYLYLDQNVERLNEICIEAFRIIEEL
jgi:ribonuclease III family protein